MIVEIVDESSAAPIIDDTERCGIDADHREMARFSSTKDSGYRTVAEALLRYAAEAPSVVQRRILQAQDSLDRTRAFEISELFRSGAGQRDLHQPLPGSSEKSRFWA